MNIERITVAVTHMTAMVKFYNAVFTADLQPFGPEGSTRFHRGTLAGKKLVFCPNSIVEVEAHQNRQQFHFVVDDVEHTMHQALNNGGQEFNPIQQDGRAKSGAVADPDGNTMEFIEYTA